MEKSVKATKELTDSSKMWVEKLSAKSETTEKKDVEEEWTDLEKQRDIAFKIMYFFIVFIIATFGLLYAYFRMTQASENEAAQRKGMAKGQMRSRNQQQNFMDFLAGQLDDESFVVNPHARKHASQASSQFTSASAPFSNLAAKGQSMALKRVPEHRSDDSGFGSQNLAHLANEERGRFDDLVCGGNKPDFTQFSNFPKDL